MTRSLRPSPPLSMPLRAIAAAAAIAMSGGCVSSSKHEALQQELEDFRGEAAAREERHAASIAKLEEVLKVERDRFLAEEARLQALVDALNAEKVALVGDKDRMKAAEQELQKALKELQARKAQIEARVAEYRGLLTRFKGLIDAGKLRVRMQNGKMIVELATDILFPSGSADLSAEGRAAVTEVAGVLVSIPDREFQVEGHTDNVPIRTKTFPSNWELAFARANSVLQAMVTGGMAPRRISAASAGEFRPRADNGSEEGRAMNRRIEIIVVPDLSQLPGAEELERLDADG
jgi:chemotaxis protein MotB